MSMLQLSVQCLEVGSSPLADLRLPLMMKTSFATPTIIYQTKEKEVIEMTSILLGCLYILFEKLTLDY